MQLTVGSNAVQQCAFDTMRYDAVQLDRTHSLRAFRASIRGGSQQIEKCSPANSGNREPESSLYDFVWRRPRRFSTRFRRATPVQSVAHRLIFVRAIQPGSVTFVRAFHFGGKGSINAYSKLPAGTNRFYSSRPQTLNLSEPAPKTPQALI